MLPLSLTVSDNITNKESIIISAFIYENDQIIKLKYVCINVELNIQQ